MVCHFWHQFLTQFSLLFQMVPLFFLSMAALRTTNTKLSDWLLELFQPIRLWLSELPYRAKWMVPYERALKTKSETGVESFTPFCWGSSLRKTNSVVCLNAHISKSRSAPVLEIGWTQQNMYCHIPGITDAVMWHDGEDWVEPLPLWQVESARGLQETSTRSHSGLLEVLGELQLHSVHV